MRGDLVGREGLEVFRERCTRELLPGTTLPGKPGGVATDVDHVVGERVAAEVGLERSSLDRAGRGLEIPVAAEQDRPRGVVAGGDVGAGGGREGRHEALAHEALGHAAAVEQDVAAGGEGATDGREPVDLGGEQGLGDIRRAEGEPASTAVAEDMDRADTLATGEGSCDLGEAVPARVEQEGFRAHRVGRGQDRVELRHRAVDEGNLRQGGSRCLRHRGRNHFKVRRGRL